MSNLFVYFFDSIKQSEKIEQVESNILQLEYLSFPKLNYLTATRYIREEEQKKKKEEIKFSFFLLAHGSSFHMDSLRPYEILLN